MPDPVPAQPDEWRDVLWREWLHGTDTARAKAIYSALKDNEANAQGRGLLASTAAAFAGAVGLCLGACCWLGVRVIQSLDAYVGALATGGDGSPHGSSGLWLVAAAAGAVGSAAWVAAWIWSARRRSWGEVLSALRLLSARPWNPRRQWGWLVFVLAVVAATAAVPWLLDGAEAQAEASLLLALAGLFGMFRAGLYAVRQAAKQGLGLRAGVDVCPPDRGLLGWWPARPPEDELAAALQCLGAGKPLSRSPEPPVSRLEVADLIVAAFGGPEGRRAEASRALARLGARAIPPLLDAATLVGVGGRKAAEFAEEIARRTRRRMRGAEGSHVCPDCLCRYGLNSQWSWHSSPRFYACPSCFESERYIDQPGPIVAVLDGGDDGRPHRRNGVLRVNWLARARARGFEGQDLFDFDRVEIVRATDDEVAHFLVDVTSDTDRDRRKRYSRMECLVGPECELGENMLRQLRAVFGNVRGREE